MIISQMKARPDTITAKTIIEVYYVLIYREIYRFTVW